VPTVTTLSEDYACATIMRERFRRGVCIPRYTPHAWWECDVFSLTERGYFREFEVKLTVRDFEADAKKRMEKRPWQYGTPPVWEYKHALLAMGDPRGPSEFYYVVPAGLITAADLPPFAGLIELTDRGDGHRPTWRWMERTVVEAPRLHNVKAEATTRTQAIAVCYYRMHAAFDAVRDRTSAPTEWTDAPAPAAEVTA
jgi:hypothetical protein